MSAEVTASILLGPIEPNSTHGQPGGLPGRRLFAPRHVLTLMENSRATWIMQRCPELREPAPTRHIQPSSPVHLLAAAVLGYTALVKPRIVEACEQLRALTARQSGSRTLAVERIDDDLARAVYEHCGEHVYGVVTWLPGSAIGEAELQMAQDAGLQIAVPRRDHRGA